MVSIVVPIYNKEKELNKCILSLINQSYKNLEIILINDGSKDSSKCICEKFKFYCIFDHINYIIFNSEFKFHK